GPARVHTKVVRPNDRGRSPAVAKRPSVVVSDLNDGGTCSPRPRSWQAGRRARILLSRSPVSARTSIWAPLLAMAIAAGLVLPACADEAGPAGGGDADAGDAPEGGGPDGGPAEEQPPPAEGPGHPDPPSRSLHNRCGGVDWQLIHGWLLVPHRAPRMAPPDTIQRCVDRYAGWVSHQADRVGLSRKSIYAALVATGQCEADRGYHGAALLSGAQCAEVHPELGEGECLDRMAASPGFGITTLADYLGSDEALAAHRRDVPL